MGERVLDDVLARRFLLGQLPPEEEQRIQELAFEDRDTFAFLESIEVDLIDDFIQDELTADEKKRFENHFLSLPGRRNNLRVSRVLQQQFDRVADEPDKEKWSFAGWFKLQSAWVQIPLTVGALALVIVAVWIFIRALEPRQPTPIQAGHDKPIANPSPEFTLSPSQQPTASPAHAENKPKSLTPEKQKKLPTYALLSPSALTRGTGVQQLTLAPNTPSMSIELALITQRNFRTYEAALESEAGKVLRAWSNLKAERLTSGKALKIEVPILLLQPQEFYVVVVSGVSAKGEKEVVARYPFEVSN